MVKVDTSEWPVVLMAVDGLTTLAAMQEYIDEMEKLLAHSQQQDQQFGLIYLSDMNDEDFRSHRREKEAQKLSKTWLKANKGYIGEQCLGIAMVTQASGMMKIMKPIAKRTMKHTMGAPGDIFFTLEEAQNWMQGQMSQPR